MSQALVSQEKFTALRNTLNQDAVKKAITDVLPRHMNFDHMLRVVLHSIQRNPALLNCKPNSIMRSMMDCAQFGLEPGLGHAALVPFGDECQLIIMYGGLIELAMRTGRVLSVESRVVYEKDDMTVEYGTDSKIKHIPCTDGDPGKPVAYYAVAHIKDARPVFWYMSQAQVDRVIEKYARNKKVWKEDPEAYGMKTTIRRLSKWLPKSPELAAVIDREDRIEMGEPDVSWLDIDGVEVSVGEVVGQETTTEQTKQKLKETLKPEPTKAPVDTKEYATEQQITDLKTAAAVIDERAMKDGTVSNLRGELEKSIEHYPTGKMPLASFTMIRSNLDSRLRG